MQEHAAGHPELRIAAVTFADTAAARDYLRDGSIRVVLLIDRDMTLYGGYGMGQATVFQLWGPKTWWAYGREVARGRRPRKSTGDIRQQGGDVLIDPEGIVRLHHVGKGPADRPSPERIIRVIY